MFVPHSKSQVASGSRSGFTSRATRPKLTMPEVVAGNCELISACSAIATFLAARNRPRISIESDTSSINTVALRVTCSVRSISKSSGVMRTGVPDRRHA